MFKINSKEVTDTCTTRVEEQEGSLLGVRVSKLSHSVTVQMFNPTDCLIDGFSHCRCSFVSRDTHTAEQVMLSAIYCSYSLVFTDFTIFILLDFYSTQVFCIWIFHAEMMKGELQG